jgi:hypothetical protein
MGKRSPVLGVDVSQELSTDEFGVGTTAKHEGTEYIWVKAAAAIPAKNGATLSGLGTFIVTATASAVPIDVVNARTSAVTSGYYFWAALHGYVANAIVATSVAEGDVLALVADANGDFVKVHATGAAAGDVAPRAKALETDTDGVADIFLY